jgi:hypothetical protein
MKGIVYWEINGRTGHGNAAHPLYLAKRWARWGNEKYGGGTHWVVECK